MDYTDQKIKELEKESIKWDDKDNSDDLLESTPVIVTAAVKEINGVSKYQVYLKSSLTNNNLFRLPIALKENKEDALIESYNFLSDLLDTIAETLEGSTDE